MTDDNDFGFQREQLHVAAQYGDLEQVRALVAAGADLDAFDELGMTPLHYAARQGHLQVAAFLLERGAKVDARDEARIGNTPLGEIAATCSLPMARLLVEAGADPTIPGWMQITALHRASARKRGDGPQVHELLLEAAARRHA